MQAVPVYKQSVQPQVQIDSYPSTTGIYAQTWIWDVMKAERDVLIEEATQPCRDV